MTKVACTLARFLPNGHSIPCVEERGEEKRSVVAYLEGRDLDALKTKYPNEGILWIPLGDDWDRTGPVGPGSHYLSVTIAWSQVRVTEWWWDAEAAASDPHYAAPNEDLDYDFADDDGVETIHIHRGDADLVVPLWAIPDDSEVPRPPLPAPYEPEPVRRRRNGLL